MSESKNIIPDIPSKQWSKKKMPSGILAIRLQAMGDMVITLPYLQRLRRTMPPGTRIDFLTREEVDSIPQSIVLFDKVFTIKGGRNLKKQLFYTGLLLPQLLLRRYDVVIDLQNNIVSRMVRKTLMPKAWSEFDRFSAIAAGESTRLTIEATGLGKCCADASGFRFKTGVDNTGLLKENGWDGISELVVLNPAGAFTTRNWPVENYTGFAELWLKRFPQTQFLVIGVNAINEKASLFKAKLGNRLINLVNKTTPVQAFAIIQKARLVVSEDSGLMHMSWVSGIPTLAMFGSTKSSRSCPLGDHSLLLHSSDLPCGNCMLEECAFGDIHCLTRYTPELIFEKALTLIK
jgi:ADP-heptose:LPS heptosyltransferase